MLREVRPIAVQATLWGSESESGAYRRSVCGGVSFGMCFVQGVTFGMDVSFGMGILRSGCSGEGNGQGRVAV